jgi:hypothetical protein
MMVKDENGMRNGTEMDWWCIGKDNVMHTKPPEITK